MLLRTIAITILVSIPAVAAADSKCPTAVTDAAKKAFPDAIITKCVSEKSSFEVKMQKKDKSIVEIDISAKGGDRADRGSGPGLGSSRSGQQGVRIQVPEDDDSQGREANDERQERQLRSRVQDR